MIRSDTPELVDLSGFGGDFSGRIEMFNWDGNLIWEFEYFDKKFIVFIMILTFFLMVIF